MNPVVQWGFLRTGNGQPDVWCSFPNHTLYASKLKALKECASFQKTFPAFTYIVKKYPHRRKS